MQHSAATKSSIRATATTVPATGAFPALRHRNFRLFFTGQLISLIGTWMQQVAQQWLVYRLTNSATKLGIVAAAASIPVLVFSLWAGVFADRLPKRNVLLFTQGASMTLAFVLAALAFTGAVQFWHVVVLAFLLGCVNAIDMPARQSFVPEMVGENRADLANAIALNSSIFNGARVIGPAVAGFLVAAVGEAMAFTLNGASYIAAIAALLAMRFLPAAAASSNRAPLTDLLEGLRYVWRDPLKRILIAILAAQTVFGTLHITLMPVFAREVFIETGALASGEMRLGVLLACFGLGALIASLSLATLGGRTRAGTRIVAGLFGFPIAFILFSYASSLWQALPLLVLGGWALITLVATINTLLQTSTPDALRGRVMSLYTLALVGLMPLGHLLAGFLAERFGSAPMAVRCGQIVVLLMAVVVYFFAPRVREAE